MTVGLRRGVFNDKASIAGDPARAGYVYVPWSDGLGTSINRVVLAKSTDGGRHWSGPTVVATGGPAVGSALARRLGALAQHGG